MFKLLAALLASFLALPSQAQPAAPDPNRVWVKIKPGTRGAVQQALQASGGRVHLVFDELNAIAVTVPPVALEALRRNPNVEYVEPDVVRQPFGQVTPYGINLVQAPQVWTAGFTGNAMKVCIIDSGIASSHPDLALPQDKLSGYASAGQSWNTDTCGHGSHVAGTIAALNNDQGVVGVNPGSIGLHIVKVFDGASCGWTYSSTLVNAAMQCKDAGAKVINMSLGGGSSSTTENAAFQSLYDTYGVLSIAAAGNSGGTSFSYPASYNSVVSVAAVNSAKAVASFSQRNSQVELAAPGVGIMSTVPGAPSAIVNAVAYASNALDGAALTTATASLVDGGLCDTAQPAYAGKVVLCQRGTNTFGEKAGNVISAGGVGIIIYNNVSGALNATLNGSYAIPGVSISLEDGVAVKALIPGNPTAQVSTAGGPGYANYDGTSMATPHVAGVAALVWSANPAWTNKQIRNALGATAEDLGTAGRDTSYGYGLVRAKAALDYLQGAPAATAKVYSITMSKTAKKSGWVASAMPTMTNGANNLLAGASVTGCFSGAISGCTTRITGTNGTATFLSGTYRTGTVKFCVTSVAGLGFDSASPSNCYSLP